MGGGGGNPKVENKPWEQQQPYLAHLYSLAKHLPKQQYFPDQGFVPYSEQTEQALGMQEQRALQGSPLVKAAQGQNLLTTMGGYTDIANTPGFQSAFEAARSQISPYIQGQAESVGRYGGGLSQENEMRALGEAFAGQWAPLYDAERARQQQALQFAPTLAAQDYGDIAELSKVGAAREAKSMEQLQDEMARWQFQQSEPWERLAAKSAIIQGGFPGQVTTSPAQSGGGWKGALGGGLSGAAAGSEFGPWGTLVGGVGGALAGGK